MTETLIPRKYRYYVVIFGSLAFETDGKTLNKNILGTDLR